jgi:hypothetical protein
MIRHNGSVRAAIASAAVDVRAIIRALSKAQINP